MLCGGDMYFFLGRGGGGRGAPPEAAAVLLPRDVRSPAAPGPAAAFTTATAAWGGGGGAEQHTQKERGRDPRAQPYSSACPQRLSGAGEGPPAGRWQRGGCCRVHPGTRRYSRVLGSLPIPGAAHRAALRRVVPRGRVIVHGPIQAGFVLGRRETKGERGGAGGGGTGRGGSCPALPGPAPRS